MSDDRQTNIIEIARRNNAFRQVIETGEREQVVVMAIAAGDEIGAEVHGDTDQVLIVIAGTGEAIVDGQSRAVGEGDLVFVRAGRDHNLVNRGSTPLRLITIYAPPEHAPGTVHQTRADAEAAEHHQA
ncbi:hypothetical protein BH24CHL5_BH24CHL5_06560 [soil metagenome]